MSRVNPRRCSGCGVCWYVCPYEAVSCGDKGWRLSTRPSVRAAGCAYARVGAGRSILGGVSDGQTWAIIQAL